MPQSNWQPKNDNIEYKNNISFMNYDDEDDANDDANADADVDARLKQQSKR